MAQGRRRSLSSSLLALNEGLDGHLITLKDVNRESPTTLRGKQNRYSKLRFENIRKSFEEYLGHLPPPGTKLTSKDFLVLHNLRQTLSGSFSLFESRVQRFIEDYGDVITVVKKSRRKRPAGKETAKDRAAKDTFAAISLIADAAAGAPRSTIETLQDFNLTVVFETQGNRNSVLVTMKEVPPRPELPPLEEEFHLDPIDDIDMDFDKIIAEVDAMARRTPAKLPTSITEVPVIVPAEHLRAEEEDNFPIILDARIRPPEILSETPLPEVMNVVILEETPGAQISPPVAGPRLVLEQATESQELLEVAIRRRIEALAAQDAAKTDAPKRTYRKKRSLPIGFLKKDSYRVNLELTSARVNKIVDKGWTGGVFKQKWMRSARARPDPYSEEMLLKEAEACIYQYRYWKKYRKEMDEDVDEIDLMVQCLQEEFTELAARTPLRASLSRVYSAIEGQTPQRHAAASPSPRLPVVDLLKVPGIQEAERSGDQHTPLLPVPPPTLPDRERSEEEAGIGRGVMEFLQPPEVQMEFLEPDCDSRLRFPLESDSCRNKQAELQVMESLQPVTDMLHTPLIPVPQPPIQPPDVEQRMEVDKTGVPIPDEAELSDATLAQNALERREELRIKVVGKLREAFSQNPLAVLIFTDLCPLSSTKHQASQTFAILIELWGEGEVILSQDSPKPHHIYIRGGKMYNSSTETCSSGSTSARAP